MTEETWYKMLVISTILHIVVLAAFSVPIKKASKKIDLSSYSVSLVGDIGGMTGASRGPSLSEGAQKAIPEKTPPVAKIKKVSPPKTKPIPTRKEKAEVSLSKKKVNAKETATKEELTRLEERLKEIKKRTEYFDVTQAKTEVGSGKTGGSTGGIAGLPLSSEGGKGMLDPFTQKYILEVYEKIKDAWGLPGLSSFKKTLETIVTIKVRKDGRIVDINIEKRSGNRVYDESILRVLRTVDPLPPIPAALNTDTIEIGFRFLPGDIS